ncbi:MAG: polyphosphate kinase 1 [Candidatus Bathyarchaeota archaeon]|nr:polyphosphate kinase 1 [Candidatus Bathyarchaeota archaeon]
MVTASFCDSEKNSALAIDKTLDNPSYYINREVSWIRFNARILEEARDDEWNPLLERIKFLAICGSNLDEFFMTRAARLLKKINRGSEERTMDGMTPTEQINATRREILPLIEKHADCWNNELLPALAKEDILVCKFSELAETKKESLRSLFASSILPAVKVYRQNWEANDIENLHVSLCVGGFEGGGFCIVDLPTEQYGRLIEVPQSSFRQKLNIQHEFVFLEDLVAANLDLVFANQMHLAAYPFRLTRNGEIEILMNESSDFLSSIKKGLTKRKTGFPSRLEYSKDMPQTLRDALATRLGLPDYLIYEFNGPLGLVDLWQLHKISRPDLKDKTFLPSITPLLTPEKSLFQTITKHDIVLYHPYDGFEVIVDLLKEAARDHGVERICITMYRMDAKSPVVDALIEAARNGKQVTAIVELKAKFDEENNILLVTRLKEAGVEAVYNFPNLKVHAKLCLIVRREKQGLARYSHVGSGNYNAVTARIYGDIGYLTARHDVGVELEELFGILINGLQEKDFKHLLVAPKSLKNEILKRIEREIEFHKQTGCGYLAFKLNNLEEKDIIKALYCASMAGIKIDLNVRALCCLKPGIPGVSENISVISIVGRFLEHARIYYFQHGPDSEVLIGSSDLMFRNLNERVEVLFSVPDPKNRQAILEHMLKIHLHDNVKARRLLCDGTYQRVTAKPGEANINSQFWLIQNRGVWHEHTEYNPV